MKKSNKGIEKKKTESEREKERMAEEEREREIEIERERVVWESREGSWIKRENPLRSLPDLVPAPHITVIIKDGNSNKVRNR